MGVFSVAVQVRGLNGGESVAINALVDTGSSYTLVGQDLLEQLGVERTGRRVFELGDDSLVEWDMGRMRVDLEGDWQITPVIFGPEGASPLLGAVTLQEFGLIADSVNERLVPMEPIRARPI